MPQPIIDSPLNPYYLPTEQGEDALTLEVQTPELGDAGLPVVVWFHGGAFVSGACSTPSADGYAFARDGVVHVSVNSRLGIDGYALLEDSIEAGVDNLGLRDQIAALEWVQRNIARFGGDPSNVTIAGQQTGAVSVAYLLVSPAARGLFRRAISQSGTPSLFFTVTEAEDIRRSIAHHAGRPATIASMSELDHEETIAIVAALWAEYYRDAAHWSRLRRMPFPFAGVVGTEMLPLAPVPALASGASADVEILAGSTKDECSVTFRYLFPDATLESPTGTALLSALHADDSTVRQVTEANPRASDIAVIAAIATNSWVRMPTIDLLDAHQGTSYLYEFAWESPAYEPGCGSAQGVDIPFVRDDFENLLEQPVGARILGPDPSQPLAQAMHCAFVDFISTGTPGWEPFTTESRVKMRFDEHSEPVRERAEARR